MRRIILLYIRFLALPFTILGVGSIVLAIAIANFHLTWLEPIFLALLWLGAIGIIGTLSCAVMAPLIRCGKCGKKAIVFPSTGFDSGNVNAIYHAKVCHHCGANLFE